MSKNSKIEKNIVLKLKETLSFSDELVNVIEKSNNDIKVLIETIVDKDKKGESTELDINNHRANITYTYLLNDDFRKVLLKLATYYNLTVANKIDLDSHLDDKDKNRLKFLVENDGYNFAYIRGSVVAKDSELFISILKRVSDNSNFTHEDFLENLRNSDLYGKESKK